MSSLAHATAQNSIPSQSRPTIEQQDSSVQYIGSAAAKQLAGVSVNFPDGGRVHLVADDSYFSTWSTNATCMGIRVANDLGSSGLAVKVDYSVAAQAGPQDLSGNIIQRASVSTLPFGASRMILNRVAEMLAEAGSTEAALARFKELTTSSTNLASTLKLLAGSDAKSMTSSGRPFWAVGAAAPTQTTDIGILFPDGSMAVTTLNNTGKLDNLVLTTISAAGETKNCLIKPLKQALPAGPRLSKEIFTTMQGHGSIFGIAEALVEKFVHRSEV